ncbi:MAG: hypothetical protein QJT81_00120 [Candidatus Thiothrix putei]|uniref:Uncharacterized protein n=1 Tax=Candidatus Thiothrix putei TaxID=3080811 RepID=A0AA95HCJ4_9GAMM|nr:MAG: hypothetical protein QJT81_00120 [Candidatus Thiothrix putei]
MTISIIPAKGDASIIELASRFCLHDTAPATSSWCAASPAIGGIGIALAAATVTGDRWVTARQQPG